MRTRLENAEKKPMTWKAGQKGTIVSFMESKERGINDDKNVKNCFVKW